MIVYFLDLLDKIIIKIMKLSKDCYWIEVDWIEKSYEVKI